MDSFSLPEKAAMNEAVIEAVNEYIEQFYNEPGLIFWEFKTMVYSRWAANEILEKLISDPLTDPFLLVIEFYNRMDYFMALSKDPKSTPMFAIARDTAEEILQILN